MMNIKGAAGLAKRAINRIVIAITNCYRTAVSEASYLTTTDTEVPSHSEQPQIPNPMVEHSK